MYTKALGTKTRRREYMQKNLALGKEGIEINLANLNVVVGTYCITKAFNNNQK
jgi:hypothetical protein